MSVSSKKVAIIGAGAAGLSSARHVISSGFECEVLEMAPELGGTWVYTDNVDKDQYGFPVYSAMYKGLRTNLPKEVMGFPDFPIPEQEKSYLSQSEILDFLNLYTDFFSIREKIKFNRFVSEIQPIENKWQITSIDKPTKTQIVDMYDAVMICNGHYNEPVLPKIPGQENFSGKQYHSNQYRSPEMFKGNRVLIIGAGPSGIDLVLHISKFADKVTLSHHSKDPITAAYPMNVDQKPDVLCIKEPDIVEFADNSCSSYDVILYCTGFKYSFPFLHESCGIKVEDNYIEPLYKHMIHIEKPTMCLIGIPFNVCAFQMFDLQARFFVNSLNGTMALPTTEEMKKDAEGDLKMRLDKGYTKRQAHLMGPFQQQYYDELANMAKTAPIPPVMVKLRDESVKRLYSDLTTFREDKYKIVNKDIFIKVH